MTRWLVILKKPAEAIMMMFVKAVAIATTFKEPRITNNRDVKFKIEKVGTKKTGYD